MKVFLSYSRIDTVGQVLKEVFSVHSEDDIEIEVNLE